MPRQYELWDELEEGKPMTEELESIDDAIMSGDAPDDIRSRLSSMARSMRRYDASDASVIPLEASVLNYDPSDRLEVMKGRIHAHLGHSTDGMTPKQIYGKYFSTLERGSYKKRHDYE